MSKGILSDGDYYCNHITAEDKDDIKGFLVERAYGLEYYIKNDAWVDELNGSMRTYIVRDENTDELVGYFSLKAGMVSLNEHVEIDEESGMERLYFDTLPGIEIADFAVNDCYKRNNGVSGTGVVIFYDFIYKIVTEIAKGIGVKCLYIFALPYDSLVERYRKYYHFERLDDKSEDELHKRLKPRYDRSCIFMYQVL